MYHRDVHLLRFPLLASSTSSFRASTRCRNPTFSRYPPPRRLASSSSFISADVSPWMCERQSMADLSSVVSFFTGSFVGTSANLLLDFRGPGRRPGVFAGTFTSVAEEADEAPPPGSVFEVPVDGPGALPLRTPIEGVQRGHFLVSSESAGTSTTSLDDGRMRMRGNGGETRMDAMTSSK